MSFSGTWSYGMRPDRFGKISALFLGLAAPFFVHAADAPSSTDTLGVNLNLSGESFSVPQAHSVFIGPTFDLLQHHTFNEYFESRVDVAAEMYTGSVSGMLPKDILGQNGPRQDLRLREAVIDAHFFDKKIDMQAGAVNQNFLDNPLLFSDFAVLGARQDVQLTDKVGRLSVGIEEAVLPSSFSLLDTAATAKTPTFYLAHIEDEVGDRKTNFARAGVGLFQFNDLTTDQARQSLYLGNTVVGNNSSAAYYLPYRGIETSAQVGWLWAPKWQSVIVGDTVCNSAAPAGANFGYLTKLQLNYLADRHSISTEIGYFNDQSDSSPAVFSDAFLDSKDHQGFLVGTRYNDIPGGYSVYARWNHADALVPGLYVGRDDTVIIGMEIRYEFFK